MGLCQWPLKLQYAFLCKCPNLALQIKCNMANYPATWQRNTWCLINFLSSRQKAWWRLVGLKFIGRLTDTALVLFRGLMLFQLTS